MKNLLSILTLIIAGSFIFTSCNQLSLTKRQYNKGFHFEYAKKQKPAKPDKSETAERVETIIAEQMVNEIEEPAETNVEIIETVTATETESEIVSEEITTPPNNPESKYSTQPKNKKSAESLALNTNEKNAALTVSKPLTKIKKILKNQRDSETRSFLWTVILIVLVVWLILYLLGPVGGALVHLLLVIALILFILWMLRLI